MSGYGEIFMEAVIGIAFHNKELEPYDMSKLGRIPYEDAIFDKYDIIEAYPYKGEPNEFYYFSGHPTIYKRCGFTFFKELNYELIVRKYL